MMNDELRNSILPVRHSIFVTVQGLKMSILSEKRRSRMLHYSKTAHIYTKMAKRI